MTKGTKITPDSDICCEKIKLNDVSKNGEGLIGQKNTSPRK